MSEGLGLIRTNDIKGLQFLSKEMNLVLENWYDEKVDGYYVQLKWSFGDRDRVIINVGNVVVLNLNEMGLKTIPSSITGANFAELLAINLRENLLEEAQLASLNSCTKLQKLNLRDNQIKEINLKEINGLAKLTHLILKEQLFLDH